MKIWSAKKSNKRRGILGFTLEEVVLSIGITALTISGFISGQSLAYKRAMWASASSAAQSLAMERLEQARGAKWDTMAAESIDELVSTNFSVMVQPLNLASSNTNLIYATNITTIKTVSVDPPIKMVTVDVVWNFLDRGSFTNTIFTYRTPDQ